MNSDEEKKIEAILMLEILGKPPEHVKETLKKIIEEIGEEKGVEVREKIINEPSPIKDQKDFYTTFAEIVVEADNLMRLLMLIFKYMPSHVDITSPEKISMINNDWNEIFNELVRRLHGYDEVARIMQNENMVMQMKLKEIIDAQKEGKKEDTDDVNKKRNKKDKNGSA